MPPDETTTPPAEPVTPPDHSAKITELEAQIAAMKAAVHKKAEPYAVDDPDLIERARRERESSDKDTGRIKKLEASITFNMRSPEFLKANASLLPSDVADIFKAAEKETYADATEKSDAIKSGLIQSFFNVQANVELLTPGQKAQLDEYLKLTKTGKQDKATHLYEMVFEPAFEMLRRTKKAEALNKGFAGGSDADTQYKNKLMAGSNKHYGLGEKK